MKPAKRPRKALALTWLIWQVSKHQPGSSAAVLNKYVGRLRKFVVGMFRKLVGRLRNVTLFSADLKVKKGLHQDLCQFLAEL